MKISAIFAAVSLAAVASAAAVPAALPQITSPKPPGNYNDFHLYLWTQVNFGGRSVDIQWTPKKCTNLADYNFNK